MILQREHYEFNSNQSKKFSCGNTLRDITREEVNI